MKWLRIVPLFVAALLAPEVSAINVEYKLSLSLGGVSIGAGNCSYTEEATRYEGADAIQLGIVMSTGRAAGLFYHLKDTMVSIVSPEGNPIFYSKIIHEQSSYAVENAYFSKNSDGYSVRLTIAGEYGVYRDRTETNPEKIYDMASMLKFSRSIDSSEMVEGDVINLPMVNGDMVVMQHIVHEGKVVIKDAHGRKYNCLKLSVRDYKLGSERETIKVYVTDDSEHIPVRLDIVLGKCFIKAVLNNLSD